MPRHPALRELQRSKSVPERAGVCWRLFKSLVRGARNLVILIGVVSIPAYLIGVGLWKIDKCSSAETLDLPLLLVIYGTTIFFIAAYVPCYYLGKARATEKMRRSESGPPLDDDGPYEPEIIENMPFRIVPISCAFFLFLLTTAGFFSYRVFRMYPERRFCDPLVYWTSFAFCTIFIVIILITLIIVSCVFFCIPACCQRDTDGHDPIAIQEAVEMGSS